MSSKNLTFVKTYLGYQIWVDRYVWEQNVTEGVQYHDMEDFYVTDKKKTKISGETFRMLEHAEEFVRQVKFLSTAKGKKTLARKKVLLQQIEKIKKELASIEKLGI